MPTIEPHVIAWMREHRSTVSSLALDALDITVAHRRELVQAGLLERVVDGAYHFAGAELDELARCISLCGARPHLVIAGPTAGRIWGIRRSPPDALVHVIAPPQSQPCSESWVRAYRTVLLQPDEIVLLPDGRRVTNVPRTVVDLTRYLKPLSLASAIESVLHQRKCTLGDLYESAERLNTRGRPWVRRFLTVLSGRLPGAARESHWELQVVEALRDRGVSSIDCQVRQTLLGYGTARFDIAIPAIRWVLEVDVHPEHRTIEGAAQDNARDRSSRSAGWMVERVSEAELVSRFEPTMDQLAMAVGRRRTEVASLRSVGLWPPR